MPLTHALLPLAVYATAAGATPPVVGAVVPLAGRRRATVRVTVARAAAPCVVRVQASADTATWDTLATVPAADPGITEVDSAGASPDLALGGHHAYLRATLALDPAAPPGGVFDTSLGVTLLAPVIDPEADAALLSKELRGFADGCGRLVAEAEADVLAALGGLGSAVLRFDQIGCGEALRAAVVRQAEHRFLRHQLTQRIDPGAAVTLRTWPTLAPDLLDPLAPYRPAQAGGPAGVWRGR